MSDEDASNPWITVSKRRKIHATNGNYTPSFITKSAVETFHTNSFTNLSIKDTGIDNLANGKHTAEPASPASSSPPHKKNKKEVWTLLQAFTYPRNLVIQA